MKKNLKSLGFVVFVISMLISLSIFAGAEEQHEYKAGNIIEFGMYPQTEVTDEALIEKLNAQELEWISYRYHWGNGSYGSASEYDYMKYADVELDGEKYRAVFFDNYRPWQTEHELEESNYMQEVNGYEINTVYWFKYEPIKWKLLDADTGLVLCESIIDSQPFQSEVYYDSSETNFFYAHYADPEFTTPANTYSASSLKTWLEDYFAETSFSESELEFISETPHLISVVDVENTDYGFNSDDNVNDTARMRAGSDYAKVQGLQVNKTSIGEGMSYWWLSDSVDFYQLESSVCYDGRSNIAIGVSCTYIGVCPAICLDLDEVEYSIVLDKGDGNIETLKYKYGEKIAEIDDPEKEGCIFTGWDGEIPETMPAGNLKFTANYREAKITKIDIIELPDDTTFFYKGSEELSLDGIAVEVTYEDGTTEIIDDYTKFSVDGFSTNCLGDVKITVTYGGLTDSFNVSVKFDFCTWFRYIISLLCKLIKKLCNFFNCC